MGVFYSSYTSISQCSSFGIGLPLNRVIFNGQNIDEEFSNNILAIMLYLDDSRRIYMYLNGPGATPSLAIYDTMNNLKSFLLAAAEKHQRFAMPLLRIAIQSPAGRPGPILSNIQDSLRKRINLSRLKRFNSEEAIEYRLIIVRPPCIKDDAPLQDETSGLG
uniref:ATP-dependent Clp protease proteolytic subunit n=1 Tax=Brassica campestris TaxID=3711 RepID=A0A3P6AVL7_BRACM|nr:unnamed protein product [Brassica rapa]